MEADGDDDENEGGFTHEEDEDEEVGPYQHDGRRFESGGVDGRDQAHQGIHLQHQAQFRDVRLLNALWREGAEFLRLRRRVWTRKEYELDEPESNRVNVGEANGRRRTVPLGYRRLRK